MNRIKSKKFLGFLTALAIPAVSIVAVSCGPNNYTYSSKDVTLAKDSKTFADGKTKVADDNTKARFEITMHNIVPKLFDGTAIDLSKLELEYIQFPHKIKTKDGNEVKDLKDVKDNKDGKYVVEVEGAVGSAFGRTEEQQKENAKNIKVVKNPTVDQDKRTVTFLLELPLELVEVPYNYRVVVPAPSTDKKATVLGGIALLKVPSKDSYNKKIKS
ncbi:Vmc-like lipoprotein signal peptide domain-containing protein [Mycoplasma sp. 1654_15]|uniref:Vmc-like lipoprotein signal peptide domain-containing protein n=1 Tax=Mycoplasma sp. 1654_15 TaxID=2725994 RepID=UPI0014497D05|nr:hypothetical protein [Mycoplasma sp. 1654_15]QJB70912.1 hypothetical protein HF996_01440 [Mycoplasma sp. 1654_15]